MINLDELSKAIRNMTRNQAIYKVLRDELTRRGYWKRQSRGNPKAGYSAMKRR